MGYGYSPLLAHYHLPTLEIKSWQIDFLCFHLHARAVSAFSFTATIHLSPKKQC